MPFRFMSALNEIRNLNSEHSRKIIVALSEAIELSLDNVPELPGKTLVVLDVSGSMTWTGSRNYTPASIGALFGSAIYKKNNADFMTFDSDARYVNLNPIDSLFSIVNSIKFPAGATNFHSIFNKARVGYDRIVVLSDMQGFVGYSSAVASFNNYKSITKSNPLIYSFDLAGHGSMQFPEKDVFCIAGFSDKVFDIMKLLESDKNALVNKIKEINI